MLQKKERVKRHLAFALLLLQLWSTQCNSPEVEPNNYPDNEESEAVSNADIIVVIGDSIANGTNERTGQKGPNPMGALWEWDGTTLYKIAEGDTKTANSGSWHPSHAIRYKQKTGKNIILVGGATGGAEWYPHNDRNNWHESGMLYTPLIRNVKSALTKYKAEKVKAVYIILGVNDARGTQSIQNIRQGMVSLINRINHDLGTPNIYLVNIGLTEHGITARVADIRMLIDNPDDAYIYADGLQHGVGLKQLYSNITIADDLARYKSLGYYHTDNLHLTQEGNNYLGTYLANQL